MKYILPSDGILGLKISISFFLFILSTTFAAAQPVIEWDKTFGGNKGDFFHSIAQTSDGGYILAGDSESGVSGDKSQANIGQYGQADFWIVKIAADGTKLWDRTYGGDGHDILLFCRQTFDSGFILGGYSYSDNGDKSEPNHYPGAIDFWVLKINADGDKEWDKTIGTHSDDELSALIQAQDGGYFLGGRGPLGATGDKTDSSPGLWLIKLSATGEKEWDRTYATTDQLSGIGCIERSNDGNYLVAGATYSGITADKSENGKGGYDAWIIKIRPDGSKIWDKTIGGSSGESISKMKELSNGGLILFGNSNSPIGGDKSENAKGAQDFWIVKLDHNQNVIWDKTIGGSKPGYSELYSVESAVDGSYILAGITSATPNEDLTGQPQSTDYWVVKIDSSGNKIWDKIIGGNGTDFAVQMARAHDGGYVVGGQSFSGISGDKTAPMIGSDRDYWIVKLASEEPPIPKNIIRINAGGQAFTTATKKLFIADQYYAGIDRTSSIASGDIMNTSNDVLYRSGRCSPSFSYNIPIPNGLVNVILHFAETYFGAPGKKGGAGSRRFHVDIEGSRKLTNYDIFSAAGGALRAVQLTFPVTVTDGVVNIDFLTGAADLPRVSAIEVVSANVVIDPLADSYVRDGSYNSTNFGLDRNLEIKYLSGNPAMNRSSYLKFQLPAITSVASAKLRIYGHNHENNKSISVHAYGVDNDGWTETGIRKANAPTASTPSLGFAVVNDVYKYYEIDVTGYVKAQQQSGNMLVSLLLQDPNNRNTRLIFESREAGSNPPQLIIQTTNSGLRMGQEEVLSEVPELPQSTVYPNPVKDRFTVSLSNHHSGPVSFELINQQGEGFVINTLKNARQGEETEIDITGHSLSSGIYLLKIKSVAFTESVKMFLLD